MKHSAAVITFGQFRLVPDKKELWKDEELIKVRSMSLAVLTHAPSNKARQVIAERPSCMPNLRVSMLPQFGNVTL